MKRELMDVLQYSVRNVAPVFAAICFSVVAMEASAQDSAAAGTEQKENAAKDGSALSGAQGSQSVLMPSQEQISEDVVMGEAENTERNKMFNEQILPLLDEAAGLVSSRKFKEAFLVYSKAKDLADPQKMGYGPYVLAMNRKIDALKLNAQQKWASQEFEQARKAYLDAITKERNMSSIAAFNHVKELATDSRAIYYMGNAEAKKKHAEELALLAEKAPAFSEGVNALVSDCDKIINAIEFRDKTSLATLDPDNQIRKDKIHLLYKGAEAAYQNQEYEAARDKLEMILVMDKYNIPATSLLRKIYLKLYSAAQMRYQNEMYAQIAENEWKWNEAVPPMVRVEPKEPPKPRDSSGTNLYDKLQQLIVDNIEYDGAPIVNVISHIKQKSKEIDPDGVGINIVLNLPPEESDKVKVKNITLDQVPLLEVLRYICQQTGLKFRVEEKTVMIGSSKTIDEMELRFFSIRSAIINSITGNDETEGGTSRKSEKSEEFSATSGFEDFNPDELFKSGGAAATAAMRQTSRADSEAIKEYFRNRGVPFDEGSAIAYDSRANKLIVNNTPENLRKLESLIRDIDIATPLVLIESKILEIKVNDLEELGFDWLLTHDNEHNPNWNWSMSSPIPTSSFTNNKLINNMNILPNFGGDQVFSLFLTVNAIDRSDRAEILSTPKVVATSGTEAVIRMVQEMYFPEEWTEPDTSVSNGSSFTFEPSYPEFGDATDIGIVFTVTPIVSPNNYTITLHLNPSVTDLTGWSDYSYDIVIGNFDTQETITDANGDPVNTKVTLKMPEISRREIDTRVKVYDGETMVLGGMLIDKQSFVDNAWPLLGDIPLIGRLFSNQSTNIEKSNLMISVTPRLMSGDGVPVRSNPSNGLPDFRR